MDPTNRRLQLLGLLQSRPEWSGAVLAEQLGVSPRTLRRDVSRLRDLGYAVDSTAGTEGGYRLAHGRALPPLALDDDEAVAVAAGLRAAATIGVEGAGEAGLRALVKLETTLPARLRGRVRALGAVTEHLPDRPATPAVGAEVLAAAALACHRGERARVGYRDRTGAPSRRDVDPHRLVRTGAHWYLVARDVARGGWRTLRVDRITDLAPLGRRVELPDPPDAVALVAEALTFGPHERRAVVRLHLPPEAARRVVGHVLDLRADGEHTVVEVGGDEPWWTARWLVSLACRFEVVDGDELVAELHRLGSELLGR